jgi:hypothetical protein
VIYREKREDSEWVCLEEKREDSEWVTRSGGRTCIKEKAEKVRPEAGFG